MIALQNLIQMKLRERIIVIILKITNIAGKVFVDAFISEDLHARN